MTNSNLFKILTSSKIILTQLILGCFLNCPANAKTNNIARPDSHAPIGVMRDHTHKRDEYMFSYRYELMNMKRARSGTDNLTTSEVLSKYMMAPQQMEMKMHMVGGMYGVTDNLTLMASGSFVEKEMKMQNRSYQVSNRAVSGFGDSKISAMYKFLEDSKNNAQFNLGLSIPSGSIKEINSNGTRGAYPMQLGSGSYEALPGVSYSGYQDTYSFGAQANAVLRLNYNNNDYRLGDNYNLTAWVAKKLNDAFSVSSRLDYNFMQKTKGYDKSLNSMMSPPNDTMNSGGKKLNFLAGVNYIVPNGALKGHRLAIEGGLPLYQNLNGIQLKNNYKITIGWQKSF